MNGNLVYALKSIIILISNAVEKKMYFDISKSTKSYHPSTRILVFSHAIIPQCIKFSDTGRRGKNRLIACL